MTSLSNPRVLYADDDRDLCELLVQLLSSSGVDVKSANTADATLQLAQAERFDLYILDGLFTDGDGIQLCRNVRNFDPQTPILFFSGTASEAAQRKAIAAGANDYIVKPGPTRRLVGTVLRLIAEGASNKPSYSQLAGFPCDPRQVSDLALSAH